MQAAATPACNATEGVFLYTALSEEAVAATTLPVVFVARTIGVAMQDVHDLSLRDTHATSGT